MSDFVYREPGKIVQDIIQSEMGLLDGQVMFTNQKIFIPTDGLYIVVSYVGPSKVVAVNSGWDGTGLDLVEVQSINMLHMIQIDIMSFDDEARTRKEEIAMALNSIFSEQQQELYNMQIARHIGAMIDRSFLEETKMVTCYTMTVLTSSVNRKTKNVDYYSNFRVQLNLDPKTVDPIEVDPQAAHP